MPRYRTISCNHCGFMQLKKDTVCERCGKMTARAKSRLTMWVIQMALMALGVAWFVSHVRNVVVP